MLAKPNRSPKAPRPSLQAIASALRMGGWIGFWTQIAMGIVAILSVLFSVAGIDFDQSSSQGVGIGIFWAVCGILVIGFNTVLCFRYTRIGRGLRRKEGAPQPKKSDTIQLLQMGIYAGAIGVALTLVGSSISVILLVAKTVSQPPGMAITDPTKIVRALDVFVVLANVVGVTGNFVAMSTAWWLLERVEPRQS